MLMNKEDTLKIKVYDLSFAIDGHNKEIQDIQKLIQDKQQEIADINQEIEKANNKDEQNLSA